MRTSKQKQALILPIKDSDYFEEAHFILKETAGNAGDSEMVKEANRIISAYENEQSRAGKTKPKKSRTPIFYFISGGVFSAVFFVLAALLFEMVR